MSSLSIVKKDKQKIIPAITHVDFSAGVQTVHPETNELYHLLINNFYQTIDINYSNNIKDHDS